MLGLLIVLFGTLAMLVWTGWHFFTPRKTHSAAGPGSVRPSWAQVVRLTAYWPLGLPIVIAVVATAVVGSIAASAKIQPLFAESLDRISHIRIALNPERLVPPPPMPAVTFLGTGIPGLETADRNWERLEPGFVQRVLAVFARMEARGYPLALLEGYRSPERQDALAKIGPHVTRAGAYQSQHQYGLALDAAPVLNGRLVVSERDPWAMRAYQAFGEEAEKAGLVWGGRWTLRDYGHIEAPERPQKYAGK